MEQPIEDNCARQNWRYHFRLLLFFKTIIHYTSGSLLKTSRQGEPDSQQRQITLTEISEKTLESKFQLTLDHFL